MKLFKHFEYNENVADWRILNDLYRGKHDILVSPAYLIPHAMESVLNNIPSQKIWASRQNRTRYLNIFKLMVSLWTSIFFKKDPRLDEETRALFDSLNCEADIDGKGSSFIAFIKNKIAKDYFIFGKPIVLTDSALYPSGLDSYGKEKEIGLRPFLKSISPLDFVDWDIESLDPKRVGKYNFLRHEYQKQLPRLNEREEPSLVLCSDAYRKEQTTTAVIRYQVALDSNGVPKKDENGDVDWQIVGEYSINYPEIPVAHIVVEPWLYDTKEECLRFHNLRSSYDNILHYGGFDKTFIVGIDKNSAKDYAAMTEYNAVFLPEGASAMKLDATDPMGHERAVADSLSLAFKLGLNQLRQLPGDSKETQSADAMAEDKDFVISKITASISDLENLTNEALKHFAAFSGAKNFTGEVTFEKDIKSDDVNRFIQVWMAFRDLFGRIDGAEKAVAKKAVAKLNLSEDDTKELLEACENLKEKEEPSFMPDEDEEL